ncbi:conserved hypothetical protein [Trichinella spiralis]|uniref:hypothetical protein n=1 Tax=Trichinella spiralis TaxID=6334 RepID=UPI0001EFD20D|nr:conserved hypothetical protein [Trichinella spiralis]
MVPVFKLYLKLSFQKQNIAEQADRPVMFFIEVGSSAGSTLRQAIPHHLLLLPVLLADAALITILSEKGRSSWCSDMRAFMPM